MNAPDKLALEFLNPHDVEFFFNENGFLIFKLCGEKKGRVELKRCYPFSLPDEYICITTLDNDEIGIIRNINELDEGSLAAAKKELYSRYYCPEITSITSLKEKMGHLDETLMNQVNDAISVSFGLANDARQEFIG